MNKKIPCCLIIVLGNIKSPQELAASSREKICGIVTDSVLVDYIHPVLQKVSQYIVVLNIALFKPRPVSVLYNNLLFSQTIFRQKMHNSKLVTMLDCWVSSVEM